MVRVATPITVVDAFTTEAFRGNPAAVCLLDTPADEGWMQHVAFELNLSETAFAVARPDGDVDLRWFTPSVEVDLCGHATLAATHVLGRDVVFHTRSGELRCSVRAEGLVEMDFPMLEPRQAGVDDELSAVLGSCVVSVHQSRFDLLVKLESAAAVRALQPDSVALAAWPHRGVIVTAEGDRAGIDCVSRFFGVGAGVGEDPVTGSAHCVLAPFWAARIGRSELRGEQASARGGEVAMRLDGDRVHLGGSAVTVWRGELLV